MRRLSWTEAKRVLAEEARLIARVEAAEDPEGEYEAIGEEEYDQDTDLYGLDIGVASTVVALSAARCVPFTSCNGGAFGGAHYERYPLVAVFAKRATAALLLEKAAEADIGMEQGSNGCVVAFSDDIRKFRRFAEVLIRSRKQFDALHLRSPRYENPKKAPRQNVQDDLPF